ncbi:hypothetical protein PR003_g11982 [Phytophthora rubi]|uniref:Uncharacterized protein n=1 Tax=Phytophthora rubi TaxID=129364 RepID=A0A6A4F1K5_9STRA|nr:hypothetical protein PR003_g11982 [Phytophthora rubi]
MAEMEAIVDSIADLTRVELQRNTLVASELIVLLKFSENVCTAAFFVCEFDAPRTTNGTVVSPLRGPSYEYERVGVNLYCLHERATRAANLGCDPRNRDDVAAGPPNQVLRRIAPKSYADAYHEEKEAAEEALGIKEVVAAGHEMPGNAHREVFCALNGALSVAVRDEAVSSAANLDLVPSIDDEKIICGAPIKPTTLEAMPTSTLHERCRTSTFSFYRGFGTRLVGAESTGGFVMSNLRTRTDNQRAEMQVLLKHNRAEVRRMERERGGIMDQEVDHRNY